METFDTMSQNNTMDEAALRWHVRLHSGDTGVKDWHAFTRWLEADPAHNDAYDAVALAWEMAAETAPANTGAAPQVVSSNIIAFPMGRVRRAIAARPWAFGGGFGAAIAATLLIMMAPVLVDPNGAGFNSYATGIGEQRTITLADGSTVMLNTNTALSVKLTKGARTVRMQRGEAFFTVHHDSTRPFKVAMNDVTVTDVGTRFDIRLDKVQTLVSVTEGLVDITPANAAAGAAHTRVGAGRRAAVRPGAPIHLASFDPQRTTAWQHGQLVFEDETLASVTAELNRYYALPVKLADNDLADMRFSGVLQIANQGKAVSDLAAFLPLSAEKTPTGILLRRKSAMHSQ